MQNGQTKEAIAVNFIADSSGSTFVAAGNGTLTYTEGNVSSYTAGDGGEIIGVAHFRTEKAQGNHGKFQFLQAA